MQKMPLQTTGLLLRTKIASQLLQGCLLFLTRCKYLVLVIAVLPQAYAEQKVNAALFIDSAFPQFSAGVVNPVAKTLWLNAEIKQLLQKKFRYTASQLRLRYWQAENKTAWILDEIGKERPITIGVVVMGGQIIDVEILAYRETRGGEVQQAFFTDQFNKARLVDNRLDRTVNGITGATLSVRAVEKVASMALYLDALVTAKGSATP